jgi:hypothetical protein
MLTCFSLREICRFAQEASEARDSRGATGISSVGGADERGKRLGPPATRCLHGSPEACCVSTFCSEALLTCRREDRTEHSVRNAEYCHRFEKRFEVGGSSR